MSTTTAPTIGTYVRMLDHEGNVVGGGYVTAVDMDYITTDQPYVWMHNGVEQERGTQSFRFSRATHTYETVAVEDIPARLR